MAYPNCLNDKMAALHKQTYKGAERDDDDDDDRDNDTSEEKTSAINGLRKASSKTEEAMDNFING